MNMLKSLVGFCLVLPLCALLNGCGTVGGVLSRNVTPEPVTQTNTVNVTNTVVQTNQVTVTLTNGVVEVTPVYTTNQIVDRQIVVTTNCVQVTNYSVSPAASNVLATLGTVNTATAPFDPYAGIITGVLGVSSGLLAWLAKTKTTQASQNLSTAQTLITAIEGLPDAVAPAVKSAVLNQSIKMGTASTVAAQVATITKNLA